MTPTTRAKKKKRGRRRSNLPSATAGSKKGAEVNSAPFLGRKKKRQAPQRTRHQQKLAKLVKQGELAYNEPMPSDVLRSMTLQEQYVSSTEEFQKEVADRRSGLVPWHRLPFDVVQEAYANRPAISKLVKDRAIRPRDKDIDEKDASELQQLRWVKEKHPFYDKHGFDMFVQNAADGGFATQDHAPIPDELLKLCTHYKVSTRSREGIVLSSAAPRATFLLKREETCVLRAVVSEWEEITAFLDRQRLRFAPYWKEKTLNDFMDSINGNYGLDDNMHWIKPTGIKSNTRTGVATEACIYFASFYLDKFHRYSICILLPIENVLVPQNQLTGTIVQKEENPYAARASDSEADSLTFPEAEKNNFHSAKIIGPPSYYCYTCLCDSFDRADKET